MYYVIIKHSAEIWYIEYTEIVHEMGNLFPNRERSLLGFMDEDRGS